MKWTVGFVLITTTCVVAGDKKPDWVKIRPINAAYYIGIGVAPKSATNRDYTQIAKDNALNDLASQITVNISSEVIRQMVEKSGMVDEDFKSHIRSTTKAELEDYELVSTWEDKLEYWVYYRLSKALYQEQKQAKINKAISLSLDMFGNARSYEKSDDIEKAILFYLQSINPIEKYANEPLETEFEGSRIFLMNEIYASTQQLLGKIELKALNANRTAKIGQALAQPLEVSAIFLEADNRETAIANLPLKFSFVRGSGDFIDKVRTDRLGIARSQVSKITATDKIQMIKADLDIYSFVNQDSTSFLLRGILNSLAVPTTKFVLNVSGLSAYIEAEELHFGERLRIQHIEPALKRSLSAKGFIFLDTPTNADLVFKIDAESRQGAEIYGMCSAFVNMNISVQDMVTGDEIYKGSLHDIKGVDLDYNKAGLKAFENAAKKVSDSLVPDIIRRIQR